MADRERTLQVLDILLTDVSENSPPSSVMKVSLSGGESDDHVRVEISTGERSPDDTPGMFNQPWPADSHDATESDPTSGQGWAICRAMVEAHGGRISAHRAGLGVRFAFTLPAAGAGSGTGSARDQSTSRRTGSDRVRILALRGDPQTRDDMRSIFSGAGFSFLASGQVSNVERLVEMERPDLLLLDMTLLTLTVIHMQVGRLGDGALGWQRSWNHWPAQQDP